MPCIESASNVMHAKSPAARQIILQLVLILTAMCGASAAEQKQPPTNSQTNETPITKFGAVGDGQTLNTKTIQSAIDHAAQSGGGAVVIPEGVFLSGAIFLKPGVNLRLDERAVLKGSTDIKDYPKMKTRIEGHFEPWIPALVNADEADHLRISGSGTLDG